MPWRESHTIAFTRIDIVSKVPSDSGVFGVLSEKAYLLISDSWNLKARLLELINNLNSAESVSIIYELCPEADSHARVVMLREEFSNVESSHPEDGTAMPGIRLVVGSAAPIELTTGSAREF
ncbi:MAG: hypothetical protein H7Y20_16980 [Bryobacteraceae bacterium]|nr:hypothetical protein [Bryobacteraceae bacterium]